jgi:hypothetical protein
MWGELRYFLQEPLAGEAFGPLDHQPQPDMSPKILYVIEQIGKWSDSSEVQLRTSRQSESYPQLSTYRSDCSTET